MFNKVAANKWIGETQSATFIVAKRCAGHYLIQFTNRVTGRTLTRDARSHRGCAHWVGKYEEWMNNGELQAA